MTARLLYGDCVELGSYLAPGSIHLAYLDPPFNVGTGFRARQAGSTDASERSRAKGPLAYRDQFASKGAFIAWLEARLRAVHGLLHPEGSLWLHLDHRAVHEAKVCLDAIFGEENFRGEVIWVPGNGGRGNGPATTHQTLLFYSRGPKFTWNAKDPALREPFAKTSLSMHFKKMDEAGRRYRDRTLGGKTYRYYEDEGRARGSVWADCPSMLCNTPLRKETTGYPTQKPLALLERIVRASSKKGDLVLDPFFGSGTTLEAALALGRKAVGADIGALALATATERLLSKGYAVELLEQREPKAPPRSSDREKRARAPRAPRSAPAS